MKRGKAYAFFDCKASKQEIEAELPLIRDITRTPSNLELSLTDDIGSVGTDPDLMPIIQEARDSGMKYALRAVNPNSDNRTTANELSTILNQTYQSHLYQKNEPFKGGITYKENGKYNFVA